MSKKRKYPTKTAIKAQLVQSATDPNQPGPISIIAESGPTYWVPRAAELLRAARDMQANSGEYLATLRTAVALLGLTLAHYCPEPKKPKKPVLRSADRDAVYSG